ncbi:YdhK family protein [Nicoliella lavandulae]|uniref:DUF1541 domain-containing protein n=1 Tax=Nicoliella lavandulae TaxID=3082954 RepID=A0ABU8SIY9_9LACO
MINKKLITGVATAAVAALLVVPAGVSAMSHSSMNNAKQTSSSMKMSSSSSMKMSSGSSMSMSGMMMKTNGGKAPKGLKMATNAKYMKGAKVMIKANHMSGMKGAMATVVGAYNTDLYTIDYTPTNGGKEVKNHKYLVAPEIKTAKKGQLKVGEQITVEADHMTGMKGAKGKIVSIKKGPAYMVNFKATNSNVTYKNHKWLAQSDLTSMK